MQVKWTDLNRSCSEAGRLIHVTPTHFVACPRKGNSDGLRLRGGAKSERSIHQSFLDNVPTSAKAFVPTTHAPGNYDASNRSCTTFAHFLVRGRVVERSTFPPLSDHVLSDRSVMNSFSGSFDDSLVPSNTAVTQSRVQG